MMNAQPDFSGLSDVGSPRALIEPVELQSILSNLNKEFGRQLLSLRAGFDLLLGDSAPSISNDQREHVHVMVGLCDDLLRLTRSYVDYAGLVQGVRPTCLGRFSVGGLVQEVDRIYGSEASGLRRNWSCQLEGMDGTITTDASICQRIFGNIVANALKYSPEGSSIKVIGRMEGDSWIVSVNDDGPGIPPEDLAKVFEPFYRLPREERARLSGDGLGLAICREMVEQLGGEIVLNSVLDRGTQVTVRFPAEAVEKPMGKR